MSLHELVYELLIVCSGKQGGVSHMSHKGRLCSPALFCRSFLVIRKKLFSSMFCMRLKNWCNSSFLAHVSLWLTSFMKLSIYELCLLSPQGSTSLWWWGDVVIILFSDEVIILILVGGPAGYRLIKFMELLSRHIFHSKGTVILDHKASKSI